MAINFRRFVFGVDGIDELLKDSLHEGSMVLIAGEPGSGKTTLASTICYKNALRGDKCLYVGFAETKDKFLLAMSRFGMDFSRLEDEGLFTFFRLPIVASGDFTRKAVELLADQIATVRPKVLVIDSINALLSAIKGRPSVRSIMQNFLYDVSSIIKGLVIITAESSQQFLAGLFEDLEYVADVVLRMRFMLKGSRIVRHLEMVKLRGAPIPAARIPFVIQSGAGIIAKPPPRPSPKRTGTIGRKYVLVPPTEGIFDEGLYALPGETHLATCPSVQSSIKYCIVISVLPYLAHNVKFMVVSHKSSRELIKEIIEKTMEELGLSKELVRKADYIVETIIPTDMTLDEVLFDLYNLIRKHRPEVVIVHGTEVLDNLVYDVKELSQYYFNLSNMASAMGIILVLAASKTFHEIHLFKESLACLIVELSYETKKGTPYTVPVLRVWRIGKEPKVFVGNEEIEWLVKAILGGKLRNT